MYLQWTFWINLLSSEFLPPLQQFLFVTSRLLSIPNCHWNFIQIKFFPMRNHWPIQGHQRHSPTQENPISATWNIWLNDRYAQKKAKYWLLNFVQIFCSAQYVDYIKFKVYENSILCKFSTYPRSYLCLWSSTLKLYQEKPKVAKLIPWLSCLSPADYFLHNTDCRAQQTVNHLMHNYIMSLYPWLM